MGLVYPLPRPFELHLWVLDHHDDFAEVTLEVNGHLVASTVGGPGDEAAVIQDRLVAEALRRC